jgi:hypothetical protein
MWEGRREIEELMMRARLGRGRVVRVGERVG